MPCGAGWPPSSWSATRRARSWATPRRGRRPPCSACARRWCRAAPCASPPSWSRPPPCPPSGPTTIAEASPPPDSLAEAVVLGPPGGHHVGVLLAAVDLLVQLGQVLGRERGRHLVEQIPDGVGHHRGADDGDDVVGQLQVLVVLEDHEAPVGDRAVGGGELGHLHVAVAERILQLRSVEAERPEPLEGDAIDVMEAERAELPGRALRRAPPREPAAA